MSTLIFNFNSWIYDIYRCAVQQTTAMVREEYFAGVGRRVKVGVLVIQGLHSYIMWMAGKYWILVELGQIVLLSQVHSDGKCFWRNSSWVRSKEHLWHGLDVIQVCFMVQIEGCWRRLVWIVIKFVIIQLLSNQDIRKLWIPIMYFKQKYFEILNEIFLWTTNIEHDVQKILWKT